MPGYIKISGIAGTSTAPGRAAWLDLDEFSSGKPLARPAVGVGTPPSGQEATIQRPPDRASVDLALSMAKGRTHAEAVVQFVAKGKVAFTYTMKRVVIQSMLQYPKREVVGFTYASAIIRGPSGTGFADLSGGTLSAASEAGP